MDMAQEVSAAIRAEIARQRRTHVEIAFSAGMPLEGLRRRLAGRRSWSVAEVSRIASVLGRPMSFFVDQAEAVVRFSVDAHDDDTPAVISDEAVAA